ncbi:MAG: hypothetical protein HY286_07025 [Planctomycetes bacterium]|nr:hypothetical protein [Planctomycetota bacterium]
MSRRFDIGGGCLFGSLVFFKISTDLPVPWNGIFAAIGCLLLVVGSFAFFPERLPVKVRDLWARVISGVLNAVDRRLKRMRSVLHVICDLLVAAAALAFVSISFVVATSGSVPGLAYSSLPVWGIVGLSIAFVWIIAYRIHRRSERLRQEAFESVLRPVSKLTFELDSFIASTDDSVIAKCIEALRAMRAIILKNHGVAEDDGLFLSFHELDSNNSIRQFRTLAIPHSGNVPEQLVQSVVTTEKSSVLAVIKDRKMNTPKQMTFGSVCGFGLVDNKEWHGENPTVVRIDKAESCQALDDSYLSVLPKKTRANFLVGSYLRTEIACRNLNLPNELADDHSFPLLICYNAPAYFTQYDVAGFRLVCDSLQRFMRRHQPLLIQRPRLVPGERWLLRSLLREKNGFRCIGPERPLDTRRLSKALARFSCDVDSMIHARSTIRSFQQCLRTKWSLVSAESNKVVGKEITHGTRDPMRNCQNMLDEIPSSNVAAIADCYLACTAVADLQFDNGTDLSFIRLEPRTILTTIGKSAVKWLSQRCGNRLVIILRPDEYLDQHVAPLIDVLNEAGISVCLDSVSTAEHVRLANRHNIHWVRLGVEMVQSTQADANKLKNIRQLVQIACDLDITTVMPGISNEVLATTIGRLSNPSQILLEGSLITQRAP